MGSAQLQGFGMSIRIKRAYETAAREDGTRVLVDRVWPRGLSKDKAAIETWLKDVAPSSELRKWFGHDPQKWAEFKRRYFSELDEREEAVAPLLEQARQKRPLTLVFAARDTEHNNAVALRAWLEKQLGG